jgi:hypothetical protein
MVNLSKWSSLYYAPNTDSLGVERVPKNLYFCNRRGRNLLLPLLPNPFPNLLTTHTLNSEKVL